MSLSIIASGAAGFAISYGLGQGATLVAALWGVFVWKEFEKGAGLRQPGGGHLGNAPGCPGLDPEPGRGRALAR